MNRNRFGKWARRAVYGTLLAVAALGCNPLNIAAFMFARDEKMPAPYPLAFDKEGPKKDKDEIVVLLLPQMAPTTDSREFVTADRDLSERLAKLLPELAKENKDKNARKLRVISPTQVDKFKIANPQWKQMSAGDIGQKLGADFVLEIWLDKMRLYQPDSRRNIYEGRAEVTVSIYEVGTTGNDLKDRYTHAFAYPRGLVRDASAVPESEFKKQYLESLAAEIARQHVDSKTSNSIADGR
jgi:hypothetical protein